MVRFCYNSISHPYCQGLGESAFVYSFSIRGRQRWGVRERRGKSIILCWYAATLRAVLDEIDSLQDNTLISILMQIREGYRFRPKGCATSHYHGARHNPKQTQRSCHSCMSEAGKR